MARRGSYGKPWRPPSDGWSVPPKAFLGGLYQHRNANLNGLTRHTNNTICLLQPNQYGRPEMRPALTASTNCESYPTTALPTGPWIGPGSNQFSAPPANSFQVDGSVDLGAACRRTGGKWVQAVRQWHGAYGFTSHDAGGCADTVCAVGSAGYPSGGGYESYQASPDQTKYLNMSATCTLTQGFTVVFTAVYNYLTGGTYLTAVTTDEYLGSKIVTIATAVDANSGQVTNPTNSTVDTLTHTISTTNNVYGDTGPTTVPDAGRSVWPGLDPTYCVANWTANCAGVSFGGASLGPGDPGPSYSGNATTLATAIAAITTALGDTGFSTALTTYTVSATEFKILLTMTPPATKVTTGTGPEPVHGTGTFNYTLTKTFSGSATWEIDVVLSSANAASAVLADVEALLGYWDLTNDGQYPPRTDGVWQVAPLMSRDESQTNVSPIQFPPATVNDYRNPQVDAHGNQPFTTASNPPALGWTYAPNNNDTAGHGPGDPDGYGGPADWVATYGQVGWFDTNAYGFTFPPGLNSDSAAATALVQYGCTGAVLGAPNAAGYQDYFDFRAEVWACCQNNIAGVTQVDWYRKGYGQWLKDAISQTGAQLPLNATQWTNNFDAFSKPPFAYLIQADPGIYATPPDTHAHRADALWAQKCVIFPDLWPSYDFFRPAGADRFLIEETTACCVAYLSSPATGGTFTSQDDTGAAVNLTVPSGSVWGGFSVGGFYHITASGSTVTLGAQVLALPATWASRSNDTATVFGMLRFPSAPAILGRDAVTTVTDNHDGTVTLTLADVENWLQTGDKIDLYSTTISYDGSGNRSSEAMTSLAANLTATVIDTTHVKVTATYATIAGTQYIMSHGAPDWCWDDNGRKGDWVYLDWTFDNRTNGENSRLQGVTDCAGNTPPVAGVPATNYGYASFTQAQHSVPFKPCCPMAICISPNGESFTNGQTIAFPAFTFDGRYGARWQAEIEDVMSDLLWQAPHTPCSYDAGGWDMDDGSCNTDGHHYAHAPLVEARISVPTNGGNSQTLVAPTPPTGIGYTSPVGSSSGLAAPGMIGFDVTSGKPSAAWTSWGYRAAIEATCGGCTFNYVDADNLPCVSTYAPATPSAPADSGTGTGIAGDGGLT